MSIAQLTRHAWLGTKRLALGLSLIVLSSSVLLLSDWNRRTPGAGRTLRVAIVQHASTPILDEGIDGVIAGLREIGFEPGGRVEIRRYNAQGDMATGNAIARQVVTGEFDPRPPGETSDLRVPDERGARRRRRGRGA
jgi:ABC-type uncharacterized transport system substrate-binding protein